MQTKIAQVGEVVVVTINGRLDIDLTTPFREACLKNLADKKVVFNLQSLNFVGSTGIQNFFQALKDINHKNKYGLRVAGMTADFQRVWSLGQDASVSIYETTQVAVQSFTEPVAPLSFAPAVTATIGDQASTSETSDPLNS